ncbi:mechanosensitive ion channel [Aggregatimonas sangjinii]|uniref:Mechanosensitive ion channel n=1 Tax=Aggregatimonas sangjinii TaxID=2583587 RepID=A0A5B7SSB5_9FLAO|nr:mechanosensitive ion channel domain-containing protein [Aggregatimonas sangjinii]QCW99902.1 mechanosensitive ion channel [Aggregatimonas sangjinii]
MKYNLSILIALCVFLLPVHPSIFGQSTDAEKGRFPQENDTVSETGSYPPNPLGKYDEAYYTLDHLNRNIGLPPEKFNFQTPQSTLEHFVKSAKEENYEDAAYALNLNLFPDKLTLEEAGLLAEKFYFVLDKRVAIDWDELPDRPDGQTDVQTSTNQAITGKPRRSIEFGKLKMGVRDAVFRMQRVKLENGGAFWMISPNTVENIESLYEIYGPRKLDRMMPKWSRANVLGVSIWKILGTFLLLIISYVLGKQSSRIVRKLFLKSDKRWMRMVANKMAAPSGLALGVLFFYVTLEYLISFGGPFARIFYTILLVALIGSIAWFVMRLINGLMIYIAETSLGDKTLKEDVESRKLLTYISVARRLVTIIVIAVGLSIISSQFESLEKLGISLLASAGLASIVLGVAAQDTLGNFIAGIQIALTRPARIGDTILIRDKLAVVEDITFTFVVARTWDQKRLVIPCKEVVSSMFENWSMKNTHVIAPIIIYVDYITDIAPIRTKFEALLNASELWDKEHEATIEVIEITEKSMKIRALCSAKNAADAWTLECKLREELMAFIAQMKNGKVLATDRLIETEVDSDFNPS